MSKIEIGKKAPQFTLEGTGGTWSLEDAKGVGVVIYFYPKDNTSGCTQEGLDFAALHAQFKKSKVCNLYEVFKEKSMYGRKYMGVERSTFLIDGKGVLRHEWRKVKVKDHAGAVLAAVKAL